MSSARNNLVTLFHHSPAGRRASILRHGLRRMTWTGIGLTLFAGLRKSDHVLRRHIADRHNTTTGNLDTWMFEVERDLVHIADTGEVRVACDVPSADLQLLVRATENRRDAS